MYIQVNEKAPIQEQIRQLKTQLEMMLDDIVVQAETATSDPVTPSGEGLPTGGSTGQLLAKKSNIDGDAEWQNGYVHPASHSPSIITQDADNRFSSDTEKATWNGKSAPGHGHSISDIALLVDALSGKSATGHGHAISDVTDLSTTLSGKADSAKGVPTGGTTDQVLAKNSNTDNDLKWATPSSGGGTVASQAEAEAGTDNTKMMTPLRTKQALQFIGCVEASWNKPTTSILSTLRVGTGTITDSTLGIKLKAPGTTTNTNSLIYAVQSVTEGTGGYRATARIRRFTPLEKWGIMGLILRNSADGKSVIYGLGNDTVVGFNRNTYSNDTSWASVAKVALWNELDFWIRVVDNLTTRTIYISRDGNQWQQVYSEAHDTYVAPNQVGVFINPNFGDTASANVRAEASMEILSWQFETL